MMKVRDLMTPAPLYATPGTSVAEARRLMQLYRIRHLTVVDGQTGELVGILSDRDVSVLDERLAQPLSAVHADLLLGRHRTVDTVMSTEVHTITPGAPVREAARLMADHRIGALPVLEGTRVVGIVTATDCLRYLESGP